MAGVTTSAEELFACYNARDVLRVFALFTDYFLKRYFAQEGVTAEALEYFAMPAEARPAEAWESIGVTDVVVLPDGRIGACLHGTNPEGDGLDLIDYTIFVKQDGRHLIDDVIFLEGGDQ